MSKIQHFSEALRGAIAQLDLYQHDFAEEAGISLALVTKIFRGELVHRKSLKLLVEFFRKPEQGETGQKTAIKLITAYLQDAFEDFGVPDEDQDEIELKPVLLSRHDRAVLHIFGPMPSDVLQVLYSLGFAAKNDKSLVDTLFAMADMVSTQQKSHLFPEYHFRRGIKPPPESAFGMRQHVDLIGGSLGEILHDLNS